MNINERICKKIYRNGNNAVKQIIEQEDKGIADEAYCCAHFRSFDGILFTEFNDVWLALRTSYEATQEDEIKFCPFCGAEYQGVEFKRRNNE